MSVHRIQHNNTNNRNNTRYYFAAAGTTVLAAQESYNLRKNMKAHIDSFKTTLKYLMENTVNDPTTGAKITYKDMKTEIKELKETHRLGIKEIKKAFPKRLVAKSIVGAIVGFILGELISIFAQK